VTLGEGGDDTRRRVAVDELGDSLDQPLVDSLVSARLLSLDHDSTGAGRATLEVAHEALLHEWPRLRDWIEESRDDIQTHRRLQAAVRDWEDAGRLPGYLLSGQRLTLFADWRERASPNLGQSEAQLLEMSSAAAAAEQLRRTRARRRVLVALTAATAISVLLAAVAIVRTVQANNQARIAQVRELAQSSIAALETDPELALLLALEAVEREPLPSALDALHRAIAAQRVTSIMPALGGAATYINDATVATLDEAGVIHLYDITQKSPREIGVIGEPGWLIAERRVDTVGPRFPRMLASENGAILAIGASDGFLVVVDVEDRVEKWRIKLGEQAPEIAMSSDGTVIAARAWMERDVEPSFFVSVKVVPTQGGLFDVESGAMERAFPDCCSPSVAITRGSNPVLIYDEEDDRITEAAFLDLESGEYLPHPEHELLLDAWLQFAVNRSRMVARSVNSKGTLNVVSVDDGVVELSYTGHQSNIWDFDVDRSGSLAASGGTEGAAHVWRLDNGQNVRLLPGHRGGVFGVEFSPNGSELLTVSGAGRAAVWDISEFGDAEVFGAAPFPSAPATTRTWAAFAAEPSRLIVRTESGQDTVSYDLETGDTSKQPHAAGDSMTLSPDGTTLAIARQGNINLFDLPSGQSSVVHDEAQRAESSFVVFSSDGALVTIGSTTGQIDTYDLETTNPKPTIESGSDLRAVAYGDGHQLLTIHSDGTVKKWDIETGSSADGFEVSSRPTAAAMSGNTLVVGDSAGFWTVYNSANEVILGGPSFAHSGDVTAVALSKSGSVFATGGVDGKINLWSSLDGDQFMSVSGGLEPVESLSFNEDGSLLVAASRDGVRVYTLDVDRLVEIGLSRGTREFSADECRQFLHTEVCD